MAVLIGGQNGDRGELLDVAERVRDGDYHLLAYADSVLDAEVADARLVPLATTDASTAAPVLPEVQGATAPEAAEEAQRVHGADTGVPGDAELAEYSQATLPYVTAPTDTYTRFFEGYRAAGGQDEDRIDAMIQCESTWTIDPGGFFLGLAQFHPGTWATVSAITGYTDPYNPFHQGFNVAVWASMISPGTSAGWPSCFYAIDW